MGGDFIGVTVIGGKTIIKDGLYKSCAWCTAMFHPNRPWQICCTKECARKRRWARRIKKLEELARIMGNY